MAVVAGRPTRIKVNHHVYRVSWGRIDSDDENYYYGKTHPRTTLIEIDHNNSPSQVRDTVLHETLHAVFAHVPHGLNEEDEEHTVQLLAPALLHVLRANPKLTQFLLES